jgi:hypothetical protein
MHPRCFPCQNAGLRGFLYTPLYLFADLLGVLLGVLRAGRRRRR